MNDWTRCLSSVVYVETLGDVCVVEPVRHILESRGIVMWDVFCRQDSDRLG